MNRIVFVEGPVRSGKTEFIEKFTIEQLQEIITALPKEWQETIDVADCELRKCMFPTVDIKPIRELYAQGKLSNNKYVEHVKNLYLRKIRNIVQNASNIILVLETNPIYFKWINGYDDIDRGAIPDASVIAEFLELNLVPLLTCFLIPSQSDANNNVHSINKRIALAHSYLNKNHGHIIKVTQQNNYEFRAKLRRVVDNAAKLYFVDANIGAGKTTMINNMISEYVPVVEPIDEIAAILQLNVPREVKEDAIEYECIRNIVQSLKENSLTGAFAIERNLFYSKWIFNENAPKYPTISKEFLRFVEKYNLICYDTFYVSVSPEDAQQRCESRGRECDKCWKEDDFKRIHDRLELLYNSPYSWPYAESIKVIEKALN